MVETNFSWETLGRSPELQTTYAQGRPLNGSLTYQGPETGEIFSWGPPIRNLEYDGVSNSNDRNGAIVSKGMGSGQMANSYKPKSFYQTGFTRSFGITSYQTIMGAKVDLSFHNQKGSGIIPKQDNSSNSLRIKLNMPKWIKATASYSHRRNGFNNGLLQSRLLAASYLTPINFDNTYGLSSCDAQKNTESIYHPDGSLRSASPGAMDNPYYLVQKAENSNVAKAFLYQLSFKEDWNTGSIIADVSGENYTNDRSLFFSEGTVGMEMSKYNFRKENMNSVFIGAIVENRLFRYNFRFSSPLRTEIYNYERSLEIDNRSIEHTNRKRHVFTLNPHLIYNANNDLYYVKAGLNVYSSSTSDKNYFQPNFGAYIHPFRMLDNWFYSSTQNVFNEFKIQYDYVTQVNEYSLNPFVGLSNSLKYNVADFNNYFEEDEISISDGILPELVTKHDFSIRLNFLYGVIQSETSFYTQTRKNSLFPIFEDDTLFFKNVGKIKAKGWEESLFVRIMNNSLRWNAKLSLSQYKAQVVSLNKSQTVPVAGFKDVYTALQENHSPGVIMGNSYQRNADGDMLIGNDGFPLLNSTPLVLGDPNPTMLIGLSNTFQLKGMELGFTLDAVLGGDNWNGTQATLDYYGTSVHTESQRNVRNYIFDGVKEDGSVNNIPVHFAPDDGSVFDYRWVRYGKGGVAEDYIEDGSRLVLKELYLSYNFNTQILRSWGLEKLSVSIVANNLITVSNYRGNLASNTLWGHSNTLGLDYFNAPQIRRYGASLKLTF